MFGLAFGLRRLQLIEVTDLLYQLMFSFDATITINCYKPTNITNELISKHIEAQAGRLVVWTKKK
jgi:hypothetical protein